MSKFYWRDTLVKDLNDREESGVIDPEGNWYNVPFAMHQEFAAQVIKELYSKELPRKVDMEIKGNDGRFEYGDYLIHKKKWVWMTASMGTLVPVGTGHMNANQYCALKTFFGEYRFAYPRKTIDEIWENSENYDNTIKPKEFKNDV